jgi:FkbM family methyltransferase
MRKIFIDCGGHIGESIERFKKSSEYSDDFLIYSFEPVPHLYEHYSHWDDITFYDKAVWIEDGEIAFFVDKTHSKASGSTLIGEKKSGKLDRDNPLVCESIDFSNWLKEMVTELDYVVLKMDIEGAEYKVLEKMIEDNTINLINKAYIEFHWEKIGFDESLHNSIVKSLEEIDGFKLLPEMHTYKYL